MDKKSLLLRLLLPLTIVFTVSIGLHHQFNFDGFFLNLATELIGIIITVAYVEWIIRKHEQTKWGATKQKIKERFIVFLNGLISGIRSNLGYQSDIYDERILDKGDPSLIHDELIRVAQQVLEPTVLHKLETLGPEEWKSMYRHMNLMHQVAKDLLVLFGSKLGPSLYEELLDLEEAIRNSMTMYVTFPEFAGVSDDELPETRTPPQELKRSIYKLTAEGIRTVLKQACRVDEALEF